MNRYRADLHIHTLLSPCGSLAMSPAAIVARALEMKLDILAITDHNSTRQAPLVQELGSQAGLLVIAGAEVTTREEVHCLALMPDEGARQKFQDYLDQHLPPVENNTDKFGYQIVVDADERIVYEEPRLLLSALSASMEEVAGVVHRLGGLFIPAHADRPRFSIISQLGFIPSDLPADAIEISGPRTAGTGVRDDRIPGHFPILVSSDAHHLHQIGYQTTEFVMTARNFTEFAIALRSLE